MNRTDQYNAAKFALNNWVRPIRIHNIKYLTSKDQYKVRCSEIDADGFTVRCTLYLDNSFMANCLKFYNKGVRRWVNV